MTHQSVPFLYKNSSDTHLRATGDIYKNVYSSTAHNSQQKRK